MDLALMAKAGRVEEADGESQAGRDSTGSWGSTAWDVALSAGWGKALARKGSSELERVNELGWNPGLRAPAMGPAWTAETLRVAPSNFGTTTSNSCDMQSPAGYSWDARKAMDISHWKPGVPEPARKFRRA